MLSQGILFSRILPHGPEVRIRRTSAADAPLVRAVLEVDRRAGTPRASLGGTPPPLLESEGESESAVLATLEPLARDDAAIARLLSERGLR
jgi:hypothetical protein